MRQPARVGNNRLRCPTVIMKLNREIARILGEPDVRSRWTPLGLEPKPTTPAEFDQLIADEMATFTKIARAANVRAN